MIGSYAIYVGTKKLQGHSEKEIVKKFIDYTSGGPVGEVFKVLKEAELVAQVVFADIEGRIVLVFMGEEYTEDIRYFSLRGEEISRNTIDSFLC